LVEVADRITVHRCDLRDLGRLRELMVIHPPDVIFNTARWGPYEDPTDRAGMIENNILASHTLLEASRETRYRRLVHFGSSTEYGLKDHPMREDDVLEPRSVFAATKAAATMIFQEAAVENNLPVVILRPFSVYGDWEMAGRLIPAAIKAGLEDRPLPITRPGIRRDFIYVEDVVNGALRAALAENVTGEIINLCTGVQTDNESVVETIGSILGKKVVVLPGAYPEHVHDTSFWVGDDSKAGRLLGWTPEHTLESGLRNTVSFISDHLESYGIKCIKRSGAQNPAG